MAETYYQKNKAKLQEYYRKRYIALKEKYQERNAAWHAKNPNYKQSDSFLDTQYKRKYGITYQEYLNIITAQKGVCAICGGKDNDRRLAVDHCHTTGKVRGALCVRCNRGLGNFKDSITALESAVKYLKGN